MTRKTSTKGTPKQRRTPARKSGAVKKRATSASAAVSPRLMPGPLQPMRNPGLSRDQLLELHRFLILNRLVEDKLTALYRQGQVHGGLYSSRGQEAISVDPRLKVMKVSSESLAGAHPAELRIRQRTGASVVAVERGEELILEFGTDFRFAQADVVYVCGSDEATRRFTDAFSQK